MKTIGTEPFSGPASAPSRAQTKIFVLDTSVVLYDHEALHSFEEHDVAIPLTVLEELDAFKKGSSVLNRNAREFIRQLDEMSGSNLLQEWTPINGATSGRFRVIAADPVLGDDARMVPDHRILRSALSLQAESNGRRVVLVTKDINLRLKARALRLPAEDYERSKIPDLATLYTGKEAVAVSDPALLDDLHERGWLDPQAVLPTPPPANHFYVLTAADRSALAFFEPRSGRLERVTTRLAYGIRPRNAEQTFALHALLHPEIALVSLTGAAGTGKTLLALASALEQRRSYRQIYLARPIVPLSNRDLGYLPGDVRSKIDPFMQPLWDNLAHIKNQFDVKDKEHRRIGGMVDAEKLQIMPLAFIRGRSISQVIFIVDEAQNLTPHEVKTIITRAGENTKVVFTGDVHQIDTPYLDARSNGLSHMIDRLKGNQLFAHINLEKGERSALANLASQAL